MKTEATFTVTLAVTIEESWSDEATLAHIARDATRAASNILTTPDRLIKGLTSGEIVMGGIEVAHVKVISWKKD